MSVKKIRFAVRAYLLASAFAMLMVATTALLATG
jgi:hypothetical protein